MADYKVGDKVKVVRAGLDITGKTAVVTDEALPNREYVLIRLDNPDTENVSQLGRVSMKESWLTRAEGEMEMTVQEMVQAINKASETKPVRFLKKGNEIDTGDGITGDVVLYAMPESPSGERCLLLIQQEEGYEVVYLPQGHKAYEISTQELERAYQRATGNQ